MMLPADMDVGTIMLPCFLAWLGLSFSTCYKVGKGFDWTTTQVLQVHRSLQCGLLAGMGLFAMGIMTGQDQPLHGQCTDSVYIMGIIRFFFCYFCTDLVIMLYIGHLRTDLLLHHGVALTGIISLIASNLFPCASAPVAATELISVFSGIEAMLPKPKDRTPGENHIHHIARLYRLAVLVILRPFLWQHVRLSSEFATSPLQAATYLIPGTILPLLDVMWSYKIAKGLFPGIFSWFGKAVNSKESKGHASVSKMGTKGANKQA
mmetsp:Transcript_54046/g.149117  ORF Transcript_54046/g.149117 Transcript_54046/m.149117 type:complete len:263 (+) Transcript_54046:261-1049(+)